MEMQRRSNASVIQKNNQALNIITIFWNKRFKIIYLIMAFTIFQQIL
jgi:hypothetical protein